jgi:hypothetical protein
MLSVSIVASDPPEQFGGNVHDCSAPSNVLWNTSDATNMTMRRTCIYTLPTPTLLLLQHTTAAITKPRKN